MKNYIWLLALFLVLGCTSEQTKEVIGLDIDHPIEIQGYGLKTTFDKDTYIFWGVDSFAVREPVYHNNDLIKMQVAEALHAHRCRCEHRPCECNHVTGIKQLKWGYWRITCSYSQVISPPTSISFRPYILYEVTLSNTDTTFYVRISDMEHKFGF